MGSRFGLFVPMLILYAMNTFATINLTGKIISATDSISYIQDAECRILSERGDTITTKSDNYGKFTFINITPGNYVLTILSEDYNPVEVELANVNKSIDLGNFFLKATIELSELTVIADTHNYVRDKLVIIPSKFAVKASVKADDMLQYLGIPGLKYDAIDRNITIDDGLPVILVNGAPADARLLTTIRSSDVLTVEYTRDVPPYFCIQRF